MKLGPLQRRGENELNIGRVGMVVLELPNPFDSSAFGWF